MCQPKRDLNHAALRRSAGVRSGAWTRCQEISVVVAALGDGNAVLVNAIDQSVLVVDPARPETGELMPQRFRLANALERVALDVP
jgi:hypothetical protein